jgi:signal transduction histidine kinase
VQQRRQLQAMLEERQRFMRIAAHDLRNMLAVVSGFSELGLLSSDLKEAQVYLSKIQMGSRQMRASIEDFLALRILERAKDGKTELFDLQKLVAQVTDEFSQAARAKDITLAARLPDGNLVGQGTLAHTHQVLTNYLSNAIKYSPLHTRATISVRPEGPCWRIEVADQGPGVLPAERAKLFVEFAKLSNKPTAGETSTRLGLSIVKALADAQGTKVGAEFPESGGSVFWVDVLRFPPV